MARYPDAGKYFTLTTVAADVVTSGFSVPPGVVSMTVFAPALSTDTAWALQILDPTSQHGGTETWANLNVYDLVDGSNKALSDIPDAVPVMIMPVPNTCVLRISFTTAQVSTWTIVFHY